MSRCTAIILTVDGRKKSYVVTELMESSEAILDSQFLRDSIGKVYPNIYHVKKNTPEDICRSVEETYRGVGQLNQREIVRAMIRDNAAVLELSYKFGIIEQAVAEHCDFMLGFLAQLIDASDLEFQ